MFAAFNEPFDEPGATGFEWLSRDEAEVQAYVDDPWCGEPLSNGFVADMLEATAAMWQPEAEAGIPTGVPVLIFSGARDPVGGPDSASVRDLSARYEAAGGAGDPPLVRGRAPRDAQRGQPRRGPRGPAGLARADPPVIRPPARSR